MVVLDPHGSTDRPGDGPRGAPLAPLVRTRLEVDLEALADDLRTVVGLRTRTSLRDRHLPALLALLPDGATVDRDLRYSSLQAAIESALDRMADGGHQRAARALVGFGPGRWRPLNQRGAEAANAFGCGWDAYRRRRPSTGASLLQETLHELARALAGPERPSAGPARDRIPRAGTSAVVIRSEEAGPPEPHPAPPRPARRRGRLVAALVAAVVLAACAVTAVRTFGRPAARAAAPPPACGLLTHEVGDVAVGAPADVARWSAPFIAAAADLPATSIRCAGPIELVGDQVVQRISGDEDLGVGALVAAAGDEEAVVVLTPAEFPEFRIHQLDEVSPEALLGTPVRRADREDGTQVVEFTHGVLVQETAGTPVAAVIQATWERWLDLGGLDGSAGRPLDNRHGVPQVGDVQEFEGGNIVVDWSDGSQRWEPVEPADRTLPDDLRGKILTTASGRVSWLVDQTGRRRWITTETDYACATRSLGAEVVADVPAAAIATLPLGEAFRCR